MKEYKVFLTGCVRQAEASLEDQLQHLLKIRELFSDDSVICIIENDSTDNTAKILDNYQKTYKNFLSFSFTKLILRKPLRTDRLAFCRNFAANLARTSFGHFDYYIVADLDNILSNETAAAIPKCFSLEEDWDVLFANSLPKYYDVWALRSAQLGITYDCWDAITHDRKKGDAWQLVKQKHVKDFQKEIDPGRSLIPVESAFNGLGIYRMKCITESPPGAYKGIRGACEFQHPLAACHLECCEHVSFHKHLITQNNKLFIAPFLLINAQMEHL